MNSIIKAMKEFNRKHTPYNTAWLDALASYKGHYVICIEDEWGFASWYTFHSVKDFTEWANGAVFENEM